MTDWDKHIVVDETVLAGKPFVRGTRIAVGLLMNRLADGWTIDDILAAYPQFTRKDILAAIGFSAESLLASRT
ncbi:antitoxin [Lamprobacter modestohalophilus]|uniref:Antitoxin n=1 Tax=Lamprobacter modestohalophilus TaxID=1064514 RepID=A0A9X1B7D8_9GAMM|nr:DUF433 domain-containing protein [Lamprobacter modestohalophilus]MBK1621692.1 antitoxin [Lamprobacter modestohalophilus]